MSHPFKVFFSVCCVIGEQGLKPKCNIDRNPIQDHVTPCDFEPNTEIQPLLFCNPGVGFIAETGRV